MRMSPNWLSGNSVETVQWENSNSGSAYPFEDDRVPSGFPVDAIVDLCVVCCSDDPVSVSCLHVGPSLVSVAVSVGGRPALFKSVSSKSFSPFEPVAMDSVLEGVSGMVTFGDVRFGEPKTYRDAVPVSESAIVRPKVGRLERFVSDTDGRSASGFVGFELPEGVSAELSEDGHSSIISFHASSSVMDDVTSPCSKYDRPVSSPVPVKSINGVRPDPTGRIAIVFTNDESEVPA